MIKRSQRDIPVSELEVVEYEQGPSDEREKTRPGMDSDRKAGNGQEQEDIDGRLSGKNKCWEDAERRH